MKQRMIYHIGFVVLVLFVLGTIVLMSISAYMKHKTYGCMQESTEAYTNTQSDCILVLGAGVREDGSVSDMLKDRLDYGIALYKAGAAPKILMSGDHGQEHYDEVNIMKQYAINKGVPSEDIFMDHAGFSTYESMYRAKEIFGAKRIVAVTQKYHMYRALYIAKQLGLEADGVSSDPRVYRGQSMREVRELLARAKDFFVCIVKPEPKYLGDAIPISGSGDATNDKVFE